MMALTFVDRPIEEFVIACMGIRGWIHVSYIHSFIVCHVRTIIPPCTACSIFVTVLSLFRAFVPTRDGIRAGGQCAEDCFSSRRAFAPGIFRRGRVKSLLHFVR